MSQDKNNRKIAPIPLLLVLVFLVSFALPQSVFGTIVTDPDYNFEENDSIESAHNVTEGIYNLFLKEHSIELKLSFGKLSFGKFIFRISP